ncbi:MAG: TraB/GumN family protein [Gammaproteobacteria bacterium]|nr:TraB/GumN family protein [Gammaproteobacteria bacterium]
MIHDSALTRMGKPVIGLETMPELTQTLSSLPYDDQITTLRRRRSGNHDRIIRESKTLLDLYLAGDLAGMVLFNERLISRITTRPFLIASWKQYSISAIGACSKRMLPYLEEGNSFIAVGALHLPDDNGLLQMLDEAGYHVAPIGPEPD